MSDMVRYITSSNGKIEIPQDIRDVFGMGDTFLLKMSVNGRKIIAEPVEKEKKDNEKFRKWLLSIKETWDLRDEIKQNRKEIEERLQKNAL
jgi:bifunctional DNA-binding transcriptional regulator/antitoxin component of YhaV-PrlF toxin-antitoxin module